VISRLAQWFTRWLPASSTGSKGEAAACAYLRKQGCQILGRNLRLAGGEIDILAQAPDGRTVMVVEVKTSDQRSQGQPPELRVTPVKQRRIQSATVAAIRRFRLHDRPIRFDVIAVILAPKGPPVIRHIPGAFEAR
jgi:putative endonuclease